MALWGRAATKAAIIDKLESLALAAVVLETAGGLRPLGTGAICYRENGDLGFQPVERTARTLLEHQGAGPASTQTHGDGYGFKWLVARRGPDVYPSLVSDLHAASKAFADSGFGAELLCAMTFFERGETTPVALVYLYKRGTFYPFAPQAEHTRNNRLELAVGKTLDGYVPIEPDLERWFPVWDVPGCSFSLRSLARHTTAVPATARPGGSTMVPPPMLSGYSLIKVQRWFQTGVRDHSE
jgi:hypothetical protein